MTYISTCKWAGVTVFVHVVIVGLWGTHGTLYLPMYICSVALQSG